MSSFVYSSIQHLSALFCCWLKFYKNFIIDHQVPIPWHPTRMLDQISLTAHAMAYMHLSSKAVIERQFCHQREPLRFYSPLTFMEFVHLFRLISAHIVKMEIVSVAIYKILFNTYKEHINRIRN